MRPKNPASISRRSLRMPGRKSLSCTTPCFTPAFSAARASVIALSQRRRQRLFAVYVLPRRDRLQHILLAQPGRAGIEIDCVLRISRRAPEVGAPTRQPVRLLQSLSTSLRFCPTDRVRHQCAAVVESHAALLADGQDRPDQVLIQPHAPGDAVHDDSHSCARASRAPEEFAGVSTESYHTVSLSRPC